MKKFLLLIVCALTAEIVSAGVTTHLSLDCREGVRVVLPGVDELCYDARWYEDGSQVVITDNGGAVASGVNGIQLWTRVDGLSRHHFVMTVLNGEGLEVGSETADFTCVPADGVLVIPNDWAEIPANTFRNCDWLSSVTIPDSVTNVASTAFAGCENVSSLTIPDYVNAAQVFAASKDVVEDVVLLLSCGQIPASSYSGFSKLKSVVLPDGLEGIGGNAFFGCTSLEGVDVASLDDWLAIDFANAAANPLSTGAALYVNGVEVTELVIPDGTTEIGRYAFAGGQLTSVTILNSVTNVASTAFAGCERIRGVVLPILGASSMSAIFPASYASIVKLVFTDGDDIPAAYFTGCSSLESVVIPAGVTNISATAFAGCEAVKSVDFAATNLWRDGGIQLNLATVFPDAYAGITNVVVEDDVPMLPDGFVDGCDSLVHLEFPALLEDFGDNDIRWFGEKSGKSGFWIEKGWLLGYIGTAPKDVVIPEGVTHIAGYAFKGQTGIESVAFPEGLKYIGIGAFEGCVNLEGLELREGLVRVDDRAFKNCTWIQDVEFPSTLKRIGKRSFENCTMIYPGLVLNDGIESIEECAFSNCWRMISVSLPASVNEVGYRAFYDCRSLTGATIPTHVRPVSELFPSAYSNLSAVAIAVGETNMVDGIFAGSISLPQVRILETIPEVSASAFTGCSALEKVLFDGDIYSIGADAFVGCLVLQPPVLPQTVRAIGDRAFKGLSQFANFKFPANLESVGSEAFSGCSGLSTVDLPRSLGSIGAQAFYGVSNLTVVNIPAAVTNIGVSAFGGCGSIRVVSFPGGLVTASMVFPDAYRNINSATVTDGTPELCANLFNGCLQLAQVDLPTSVTNIGASAFLNCSSLTAVGIPRGVKVLGTAAFMGCSSITSLSLPQGLTNIADDTFNGCSSLLELVIPGSVTSLGAYVFNGCSAMSSVSYVGDAPSYVTDFYHGAAASMVSKVVLGTTGWDGVEGSKVIPENWPVTNPRSIEYWDVDAFDVSFYGNGGEPNVSSVGQISGLTYALPLEDPVRTGYDFTGWWTETENGAEVKATSKVTATRPHNLYAHWSPVEYSVTFNANGGLGVMDNQSMQYGTAALLATCGFIKQNAEFAGWAVERNGAVVYADGEEVMNLASESGAQVALYAVWIEREWTAADYLGCPNRLFTDAGDAPWVPDVGTFCSAPGSMRSGEIGAAEEYGRTSSVLKTTVFGEGSGTFQWKVDCEPSVDSGYYDYALFEIDDVEIAKIAGHVNWTEVEFQVRGAGEHTLRWTFTRDDYDDDPSAYENAAWLDDFVFVPTPVVVSFDGNGATEGVPPSSITSSAGETIVLPDAGTLKNGTMLFEGWFDADANNTYRGGAEYVVGVTNVVLSASWCEHEWTIPEILGATNVVFSTNGDAAWVGDFSTTHDGKVSLRSGAIADSQESRVSATFSGKGELSFWTKTDGEFYRNKMCDYLKVQLDGTMVFSGVTNDWMQVTVPVEEEGEHTVVWTYLKNDSRSAGNDCAWLSEVVWVPTKGKAATEGTPVPVEFGWIKRYYPALSGSDAFEAKALSQGANGLPVWESFVAGLDPTNVTSQFTATITMGADGKPIITWSPDLSGETGADRRVYKAFGKEDLEDADWSEVTELNRNLMHFFKVTVEMPE